MRTILLLALGLTACSSTARGEHVDPVIDDIEMAPTAKPEKNGFYNVRGTITAHTEDALIGKFSVWFPTDPGHLTYIGASSTGASVRQDIVIQIPATAAPGRFEYHIYAVDTEGRLSGSRQLAVMLQ